MMQALWRQVLLAPTRRVTATALGAPRDAPGPANPTQGLRDGMDSPLDGGRAVAGEALWR